MSPNKEKIILGIDPGLADTGYGLVKSCGQEISALGFGSIKTAPSLNLPIRLVEIEKQLQYIIKKYQPDLLAIEKLYFCRNVTTAMAVGQARGVVVLTAVKAGLPIIELTPLQVKQGVTGYGQADKKQIQQMVKAILGMKEIPQPDDAADALAIGICASNDIKLFE